MKVMIPIWSMQVGKKLTGSHRPKTWVTPGATAMAVLALAWPATAQQHPFPYTGAPRSPMGRSVNRTAATAVDNADRNIRYTVTDIGVLPGKQSTFMGVDAAVNNSGVVTGYSYNGPFGGGPDFDLSGVGLTWEKGVFSPLPLLPGWPGAFAFALNENKQVCGVANKLDNQGNVLQTAVLWDHGTPINLGTLQPNSVSFAGSINNRGQVVGGSFSFDLKVETPFIWSKGQMKALPLLPTAVGGEADGINDSGEIAGVLDFGSTPPPGTGEFHPVVWIPKADSYIIQDLGGLGGDCGGAQYLDNRGQVVGKACDTSGVPHALLWQGGAPRVLATQPSLAFSINQREQIVGAFQRADGNFVAFIWEDGVLTDVNDLVPAGTPLLVEPTGLNSRGEFGAIAGLPDGGTAGFLITPIHD